MASDSGDPVSSTVSSSAPVAAIAALDFERSILLRAWQANAATRHRSGLVAYCSGPGPDRAERSARQAIAAGASALLSFGIAGGLRSGVTTGTVLLPQRVVDASGSFSCEPDWCTRIAAALTDESSVLRAVLVSIDHVATSLAEKRSLAERYDADAVDMESAAIGRVAAEAGLPFAALRVVADGPDDVLPGNVERLVTATGRTNVPALLGYVATPGELPLLIRLGRRSARARAVLGRVAMALARADACSVPVSATQAPS